jgi:hypothetical protein
MQLEMLHELRHPLLTVRLRKSGQCMSNPEKI